MAKTVSAESIQWMLFERGAALAGDIPIITIVQVRHPGEFEEWLSHLRVTGGDWIFRIRADVTDTEFRDQMDTHISELAAEIRERQRRGRTRKGAE